MSTFLAIIFAVALFAALAAFLHMREQDNRRVNDLATLMLLNAAHTTVHARGKTTPPVWVTPAPHHYTGARYVARPVAAEPRPATRTIELEESLAATHEVYLVLKPHKVDEIIQRIM